VKAVATLRAVILAAGIALATGAALAAPPKPSSRSPSHPLTTAIFDPLAAQPASRTEFARIRATGATVVRLPLRWAAVAPAARGARFDPQNPDDPAYRWQTVDAVVRAAAAARVQPILDIVTMPPWALKPGTGTPGTPVASDLGAFARAAALRYDGRHGLPHVRYWQVWNEPNLGSQLSPQLVNGRPVGALAYRAMVNAFAAGVKPVASDNVVIAGGLAPFRDQTPATQAQDLDWGPLSFMRAFFCLSASLRSSCSTSVRFDVWSHHPYTSGGPTHHAALPNDVSLGDLPRLVATLRAAVAAGHVQPRRMPQLWVTEFSWDSNPPDPNGVPTDLLDRWVPQALYAMWRNGVSLVTWFSLDDQPLKDGIYQSGLHFPDGKPKSYLVGFRFPVVAFPRGNGFSVWGRTPTGTGATVTIEQRSATGGAWRRVASLRADASGIFQATVPGDRTGFVRARVGRQASLPFSLASVPDRTYVPFGLGDVGDTKGHR
jgi:hypothetical protein